MPLPHAYTDNDRFHKLKPDSQNRSINRGLNDGVLTPDDVEIIQAYINERGVITNPGPKRVMKMTSNLVTVKKILNKPFRDVDIVSIYATVNGIHNGVSIKGTPFSPNTKTDLIQVFKSLLLWMLESEIINLPEKKIRAIKLPKKVSAKTSEDLISPEQITTMIAAAKTSRYRAMLMTLYEGGFRIGEIGEMRWKDLSFDGTGVIVQVRFKTEKTRYVRLVMANEYLIKWKSDYPGEPTGENFVFLSAHNGPMTYPAILRGLERLTKRVGIEKHITPHLFRHSRITHLLQQGVSESIVKMMMWGTIESKMFKNYAHLTGGDTDREIFRLYGIEQPIDQVVEGKIEPRICSHCHELNAPISRHCHLCGYPLTEESIQSSAHLKQWLLDNGDELVLYLQSRAIAQAAPGLTADRGYHSPTI